MEDLREAAGRAVDLTALRVVRITDLQDHPAVALMVLRMDPTTELEVDPKDYLRREISE